MARMYGADARMYVLYTLEILEPPYKSASSSFTACIMMLIADI